MDPTSTQDRESQRPQPQPQTPQPVQEQVVQQPTQQVVRPTTIQQPTQPDASGVLEEKPKRSKVKLFGFLLIIFFLIIFVASGALAYAVAYEKIKLTKYPEVQTTVANYVISLPFMPKTAKFLLLRSILTHQNATKQSFDVSLALDSSSLADILGINRFDTEAKGAIDYSNPENTIFQLEASLTKDFNIELRKKDPILYFKINKLPVALLSIIGFDAELAEPILEQWVAYDTTPPDTQARRELQDKEIEPLSKEFVEEINKRYFDDYILSKMQISQITENGVDYYKLSLNSDSDLIDYIGNKIEEDSKSNGAYTGLNEQYKLSDMIKKVSWEIYIAKNTYYTHKLKVTSTLEFDQGFYGSALLGTSTDLTENSQANFALIIKFDDFGKEVIVDTPQNPITYEEFLSNYLDIVSSDLSGTMYSDDARRIADMENLKEFLDTYNIVCEGYPDNIEAIVTPYPEGECKSFRGTNFEIPKDPDGSDYHYKAAVGGTTYDLCAKLDTPISEKDTCPDENYNYHLTAP